MFRVVSRQFGLRSNFFFVSSNYFSQIPSTEETEFVDTFAKDNKTFLGTIVRSEVHRKGLFHRSVNVLLFNSQNELLIQKRANTKRVCPGKWDLSCAEHLQPSESYFDGAVRGLKEELNVNVSTVEKISEATLQQVEDQENNVYDYEFAECYKVIYDGEINIDPGEINEAKFISLPELKSLLSTSPNDFTPWAKKEFNLVL